MTKRVSVEAVRRDGFTFVCEVPFNVERLEIRRGRVVASGNGMHMIVPSTPIAKRRRKP